MEPSSAASGTEVVVPCPKARLDQVRTHIRRLYGPGCLTLRELEGWWGRNPYVLGVLLSQGREYLGHFAVLPLTAKAVRLVVRGEIEEEDIAPDHILPPDRMRGAGTIYVVGLAVEDAGTEIGRDRAANLVFGLTRYMDTFYGSGRRRVLAAAASLAGHRFMRRISARLISLGKDREDEEDLYEVHLTAELLRNLELRAIRRSPPPTLSFKPIDG